jgi:uncharacterized membrane protein YdjX (TVP38/TMEM64 family)
MTEKKTTLSASARKKLALIALILALIIMGLIGWFVGRPLVKYISEPEAFRNWVESKGFISRIAFIGMMVLQIMIALIPGEPFELAAGYAFGAIEGTILCLVACSIGSIIVFFLVRCFGMKLVGIFFSEEQIAKLKFLKTNPKREMLFLVVYILPGTPKDILSYYAGLTDMKFFPWFLISFFGRIPSVLTSTVGGNALGKKQYLGAIIVFAVTLAISGLGIFIYNKILAKHK